MQADERVRIVPMPTRMSSPVDHDHGGVGLGQQDVHEAHAHRTRPDDDVVGLERAATRHRGALCHGLASYTLLNGVEATFWNRPNPAPVTMSRMRASPAWAPRARPTSWDSEHGVQSRVENA